MQKLLQQSAKVGGGLQDTIRDKIELKIDFIIYLPFNLLIFLANEAGVTQPDIFISLISAA